MLHPGDKDSERIEMSFDDMQRALDDAFWTVMGCDPPQRHAETPANWITPAEKTRILYLQRKGLLQKEIAFATGRSERSIQTVIAEARKRAR